MSNPGELKDYVDIDDALGRLRGNKAIYKKLLETFLRNDTLDKLKESCAAGDMENAAMHAHSIKGMAGNLSLKALQQSALEQEALYKAGSPGDVAAVEAAWNKTREYIDQVLPGLG